MPEVKVQIVGYEYRLNSPLNEEHVLKVASHLNDKILELLNKNATLTPFNATMLVALNVASELLQLKEKQEDLQQEIEVRMENLLSRIEQAEE